MSKKTKAELEKELRSANRELKKAKNILKNITECFEREEGIDGYNLLIIGKRDILAGDLDGWLDEARMFLGEEL